MSLKWSSAVAVSILIFVALMLSACSSMDSQGVPGSGESSSKVVEPQVTVIQEHSHDINSDDVIEAFEMLVGDVHDKVLPSVVQLKVGQRFGPTSSDTERMTPFGDLIPEGGSGEDEFIYGEGSGFVWSEEGHIVTSRHVVLEADVVTVVFPDGTELEGNLVGEDRDSDLAVIKVTPPIEGLTPVALGDSSKVRVGQVAIAIGSPFRQEFTTTTGIISAIGRTIRGSDTPFSVPKVIQTDAPINPGNSGGPLLNRKGEVIGINAQIISGTRSNAGIGLAIPINIAKQIIPSLIEIGDFQYSWLGISGTTLRPKVRDAMGLPEEIKGAQVIGLAPEGPAEKAGRLPSEDSFESDFGMLPIGGDVIIGIDDLPITNMETLIIYLVEETLPGDLIVLDIIRSDSTKLKIEVTLGKRPAS